MGDDTSVSCWYLFPAEKLIGLPAEYFTEFAGLDPQTLGGLPFSSSFEQVSVVGLYLAPAGQLLPLLDRT
jgi:hypothetical protein